MTEGMYWISIEWLLTILLFIITSGMSYYACFYHNPTINNLSTTKNGNNKKKKKKPTDLNLVLYANGLYENLEKPNALWTLGIEQSEFNTIILWTLHIRENGDLVYNDFLMVSNGTLEPLYGPSGTHIRARIQELKTFGNVKHVIFSIGSGSWYDNEGNLVINPDFYNLYQILYNGTQQQIDNLYANINVLIELGIDGFDSDCEEWGFFPDLTHQDLEDVHVKFFSELYTLYPQLIFTFVPYRDRADWLSIAKILYTNLGIQIVKFWSVQMYGPGSGTVQQWIDDIRANAYELGLTATEVDNYIIPGYDNSGEYWPANTPERVREIFAGLNNYNLDINGGMIWNLSQTYERDETLKAYSDAIIDGLS